MTFEIETVPLEQKNITTFLCRRGRKATVVNVRKFLAECGTKIVVEIGIRGNIVTMKPEQTCDAGTDCPRCKDRMNKIAILIESGK
jgi:hypothetical protein